MSRQFECTREVTLPATPEQVWQAVATAAGNSAWLFPNEIAADGGDAAVWDPPHHFAVRQESGEWFNALDFQIEAIDGSTTRLRTPTAASSWTTGTTSTTPCRPTPTSTCTR